MSNCRSTTYTITKRGSTPWRSNVPAHEVEDEVRRACRVAGNHEIFRDDNGEWVPWEDFSDFDEDENGAEP